ncbi:MAG: septum formation family protein [Nakamurella sp.]
MPSTTAHHTTPGPPAAPHRRIRLAGAVAAAALAFSLAACGSEPEPVEQLAAPAADIAQVLKEADKSRGETEVPSREELNERYEQWLASKAGVGGNGSSDNPVSNRPDEPLGVGDCTDHIPTGAEDTAADIASVDCDDRHLTEVYLSVPLEPLGPDYPRHADIVEAATEGCGAGFVDYIGIPWLDSQNTFQFVTPSEASWQDGDTTALCFAYPGSFAAFTGTLKGSNQ